MRMLFLILASHVQFEDRNCRRTARIRRAGRVLVSLRLRAGYRAEVDREVRLAGRPHLLRDLRFHYPVQPLSISLFHSGLLPFYRQTAGTTASTLPGIDRCGGRARLPDDADSALEGAPSGHIAASTGVTLLLFE